MIDLETELRLDEDVVAVAAFLADNGGAIVAGWDRSASEPEASDEPGVFWLTLRPRSAVEERYFVRVGWSRYPGDPPSVKFADAVRGRLDVTRAWPIVPGYRAGNADICADFTKEGYTTHPEWVSQRPWRSTGNPFLWVVQLVQGHLDRSYGGRAA